MYPLRVVKLTVLALFIVHTCSFAQEEKKDSLQKKGIYAGLKFRSIGPAFMSGRVSDIAIHPNNENIWYVTIGSGGVWKTENAATTWKPIFDGQSTYSVGCITLDPQNPEVVWVGTGENVGGRHVSYGDGIYRSQDGGKTWKNMGLKNSEHISKIIIHPTNSDILWVASQGPLWSSGGERGVYKTTDGGKSWNRTLGDDKWVGATDIVIDPGNPNLLYSATWQRHRTVAGYMGGGPGTGIYRSQDGGESWEQLKNGLPKSNMGKIGLAMAPQDPNILYAAIELDRRKGGVYRSEDRGSSWQKMSDAVAGGTGPHYYQELFASPHQLGELYLADNYMQVSFDGGKTFSRMNEKEKHVDNHAVVFKKNDPNYILVGCDGGLYESFDKTKNWKFIDNLPVTQFYKIAVDDDQPFYNVYGGTQDNNTQGAPSRTDNLHGIRNSDWYVVLGGDGHQPATEPGNPNIVYAQWQQGNLNRYDRATGENVNIKPLPELGEKTDRFNWDAPILVSPHDPQRVYFASQRVWKSEDRGDSWKAISKDLTNNIERVTTPFFGKQQKWDNPWDVYAMSNYSTVTSLSESPLKEGLIYAGTDDGVIQITEDGGNTWRLVDFKKIKGLPATAFVHDIKTDLFDENVVYAVFDNHKFGDYSPYLFKSTDKGLTWVSFSNNLPERTLLWRIVQDHVNKDLMFIGTEFGLYFTNDGGKRWSQLRGGLPNISVRDIAIQKRENDLVLGTFGRGIYILDDYSSLREFSASTKDEARLFTPRDGYWYIQKRTLGGSRKAAQGDNFFVADNPAFGVEFTYYLKEKHKSKEAQRKEKEKKMEKANQTVAVPKWSILEEENKEIKPKVWIFIYAEDGEITRKIEAGNRKGFNRISWNLTNESVRMVTPDNVDHKSSGYLVSPGKYSAELFKQAEGKYLSISDKVSFNVVQLNKGHLTGSSSGELASFWEEVAELRAKTGAMSTEINELKRTIDVMLKAHERAGKLDESLQNELLTARSGILDLKQKLNGSKPRSEIGEKNEFPTIWSYLGNAGSGISRSSYGPTATHRKSLNSAQTIYDDVKGKVSSITNSIEALTLKLKETGAPEIKK